MRRNGGGVILGRGILGISRDGVGEYNILDSLYWAASQLWKCILYDVLASAAAFVWIQLCESRTTLALIPMLGLERVVRYDYRTY